MILFLAIPVFSTIISHFCSAHRNLLSPLFLAMCSRRSPPIPSPLVIAYASHGNESAVTRAITQGANVIIWFSINLESIDGTPRITGSVPSPDYIGRQAKAFREAGYNPLHIICIGGWNAPLPDTSHTPDAWFDALDAWNRENVRPSLGWNGFDGFDWDAEGHDDPTNVRNHVKSEHLTLIGELSIKLKHAGYIVSMAPAQSYLDVEQSGFDLNLTHAPKWEPDFEYHGRNLYAYWLVFYGRTDLDDGTRVDTFDWVCLQLYEGWSRANNELASKGVPFGTYLPTLVSRMSTGWRVDFGQNGGIKTVSVPKNRLVIGLANGWTSPFPPMQKFLLLLPDQIRDGWTAAHTAGFAFWTVDEEGKSVNGKPFYLTKELAAIVNDVA